ncbi:glutathione hydrolase 1 proenzyme [Hydra vulgaris]|uniref:Glutathione hydrolase 1 proenzyme n=1 Tax=Hydra vulgaris TaxID=6087 RepID=A0ABM4CR09_HYDVU
MPDSRLLQPIIVCVICLMLGSMALLYRHNKINNQHVHLHKRQAVKRILMGGMVTQNVHTKDEIFQKAAVATDNTECSLVGKKMLVKGGSAVDAAIAALLCLGVINSHSTGIGGGGFMMVYIRELKKATVIDFRETAPSKAHENLFGGDANKGIRGGLAVAVPGELRGMQLAHEKFGKLPWKDLFEPAIKLAKEGFHITDSLQIALNKWKKDVFDEPCLRKLFVRKGKLLSKGNLVKNVALAKTLEKIASHGNADVFYKGKLAKQFVKDVKKKGGIITEKDLHGYTPIIRTPLQSTLGNFSLLTAPPPASGPILALILNILKGYNMTEEFEKQQPEIVYHRMIEAFNFAYARRTELADPDVEKNTMKVVQNLLDENLAKKIRNQINDSRTYNISHYGGKHFQKVTTGTTHLVVVGPNGDAVTVMSTINGYLGAKFRSCKLGFIYNNEMDDFSTPGISNEFGLPPSEENFIKPDKRPMSSSVPVILLDSHKNVRLVTGGSGGSIITTAVAQVIMNHLWFGMSMRDAVQQPRVHSQLVPSVVYVEPRMPEKVLEELKKRGHDVRVTDESHAVVQAIARVDSQWKSICKKGNIENTLLGKICLQNNQDQEALFAESDFRKGGTPAGF